MRAAMKPGKASISHAVVWKKQAPSNGEAMVTATQPDEACRLSQRLKHAAAFALPVVLVSPRAGAK